MMYSSALETLHQAIGAAIHRDLPDIHYFDRDWQKWRAASMEERKDEKKFLIPKNRRPHDNDITVDMFVQTWGSTATGYGGIGGAAMTDAYTVVIYSHRVAAVYFGGSALAYMVDLNSKDPLKVDNWRKDISARSLVDVASAGGRYNLLSE